MATAFNGLVRAPPELEQVTISLHDHDVLLGCRGEHIAGKRGNTRFRHVIWFYQEKYLNATRAEKTLLAKKVLSIFRALDPPGRFLKEKGKARKGEEKVYVEVSTKIALKEINDTFTLKNGAAGDDPTQHHKCPGSPNLSRANTAFTPVNNCCTAPLRFPLSPSLVIPNSSTQPIVPVTGNNHQYPSQLTPPLQDPTYLRPPLPPSVHGYAMQLFRGECASNRKVSDQETQEKSIPAPLTVSSKAGAKAPHLEDDFDKSVDLLSMGVTETNVEGPIGCISAFAFDTSNEVGVAKECAVSNKAHSPTSVLEPAEKSVEEPAVHRFETGVGLLHHVIKP